jgi:hypothetical protein
LEKLHDPKRVENTEIPLAPYYPPSLTPTDYALISGNNVTKVAIVMELANQKKATLIDLRRSTERHCSATGTTRPKIPFLAEQPEAIRDLKGDVPSKMAFLEQKGLTVTHVWQASLLEKEVMRNQEHNQGEKFDGGHHYSNSSSPFANVGLNTPTPHGSPAIPAVPGYFLS